jgi:hypothetical protein
MTPEETRQALRDLSNTLTKVGLPGVELVMYEQHLAVIAPTGDFSVWVSPWGHPLVYKIEGAVDSYRCAGAKNATEIIRKLTKP